MINVYRFLVFSCVLFTCIGTAKATCYSCFSLVTVQLEMTDGSNHNGILMAGWPYAESSIENLITEKFKNNGSTEKLQLIHQVYGSNDKELQWIKNEKMPDFLVYSQDTIVEIDWKEIASVKETERVPMTEFFKALPDSVIAKKNIHLYHVVKISEYSGDNEMGFGADIFVLSTKGPISKEHNDKFNAILKEKVNSPPNEIQSNWEKQLTEGLQMDPSDFILLIFPEGC